MKSAMDGFIQVSPIWLNVITVVWDFKSYKKRWLHGLESSFFGSGAVIDERCSYYWGDSYHMVVYTS